MEKTTGGSGGGVSQLLRIGGAGWQQGVLRIISRYALLATLVAFWIIFSALRPSTFFTLSNVQAIIGAQAVLLLVALGLTIPLAAGDFDLSIGFTLGFTMATVTLLTVHHNVAWPLALLISLAAGLGIGLVNAFVVVIVGVNAFIVTLGSGTILNGITQAITGGLTVGPVPLGLQQFSNTTVLGFPLVAYYGFGLAAALWYVYEHTPLGRYILFVGGGREAARLSGLPVTLIRMGAFVFAGGICGFAGILAAGQLGAEDPTVGQSYLLPAYAAAFLGATTIKPGRFNAWGTVLALYTLATGITGLQLLGAPFWVEPVFNGSALTLAVIFARLASRSRAGGERGG